MSKHTDRLEQGRTWARVFGLGETPRIWGLPVLRTRALSLRIHIVFFAFMAIALIRSIAFDSSGPAFVLAMVLGTLVASLAHELSRLAVSHLAGRPIDEIVLWPLGGLADSTGGVPGAVGALAGSAVFAGMLGAVLLAVGVGWPGLVFNPLDAGAVLATEVVQVSASWWLTALWSAYLASLVIILLNALVPAAPLDAGVVARELAGRETGRDRFATRGGLVLSVGLVIAGALAPSLALAGAGLVCAFVNLHEARRSAFVSRPEDTDWDLESRARAVLAEVRAKDRSALRESELEIDRILGKISEAGMDALSDSERAFLRRATADKQGS